MVRSKIAKLVVEADSWWKIDTHRVCFIKENILQNKMIQKLAKTTDLICV